MKSLKFLSFLCISACTVMLFIPGCRPDPDPVLVSTITAQGTSFEDGSSVTADLNGSASAEDVPLNAIITVTFDKSIESGTASLSSANGDEAVTVTTSATTLTIDPDNELERGTQYTLSVSGVTATDGGSFSTISRTFTTEGRAPVVVPNADQQVAYYNFDATPDDQLGNYTTGDVIAITYGNDRFGQGNSTASFDGDESIIEVLDADQLMANKDFTVSFWVKTNSEGHVNADGNPAAHFVFGLAAFKGFQFEIPSSFENCKLAMSYEMADGTFQSEDLWFPGNGEDKDNGGWQGWDFVADLTGSGGVPALIQDKWAHIICTYDSESRKGLMYINGQLMKSQDFNLWPDGAPKLTTVGVGYSGEEPAFENILAFGFIKSADSEQWADSPWGDYYKPTANHFKGDLDDVRFFSTSFSASDAADLYDAEK